MSSLHFLLQEATPLMLKHCVAAVAPKYGGDTSRAFAICVATLQKAGYLKKGTMELTDAGQAKQAEHEREPDRSVKFEKYEKLLKQARESIEEAYVVSAQSKKTSTPKKSSSRSTKKKQRSRGRPALPVGSVRRWKKRGQVQAMVKVSKNPPRWVVKKRQYSHESAEPTSNEAHIQRLVASLEEDKDYGVHVTRKRRESR